MLKFWRTGNRNRRNSGQDRPETTERRRFRVCVAAGIVSGSLLVGWMWFETGRCRSTAAEDNVTQALHQSGDFVILEPDTWVGERFPLLGYLDRGDELAVGQWIAVLYVYDCPPCRAHMPHYERMARGDDPKGQGRRIALVEVPPYAPDEWDPVPADTHCHRMKLASEIEWFVETPLEIWLQDGRVLSIKHD